MKNLIVVAIAMVGFTFVSCDKEETPAPTPVTATISITSLSEGDTINQMDMAMVHGTITGTAEMHGYSVVITNETTSETVHSSDYHSHSSLYTVHEHWMNNVTVESNMKATITAALDDSGLTEVKVVNFVCKN